MREIASGLRFPEGPVALPDGSVLLVEIARGCLTRVAPGGAVTRITLGGSPNGAAIGPDGACYVCNSGGFTWHEDVAHGLRGGHEPADYSGGRIERVDLTTGRAAIIYDRSELGPLKGPNDLVFDRDGGFWFTDSGKVRGSDRDHGGLFYARVDGSLIRPVVHPNVHPHPNGVGLSPDGSRVYMAETHTGRVWQFEITGPGEIRREPFPSPNGGRLLCGLPGYRLLDSLALEASGNVCVATMMDAPGITVIAPGGEIVEHHPMPDTLTTNLCFGGPDLRTAYITLSGSGRLVAVDWPRPGLPLHFLDR